MGVILASSLSPHLDLPSKPARLLLPLPPWAEQRPLLSCSNNSLTGRSPLSSPDQIKGLPEDPRLHDCPELCGPAAAFSLTLSPTTVPILSTAATPTSTVS